MIRILLTASLLLGAGLAQAQASVLDDLAGQGLGSLDAERLRLGLDQNAILDVESALVDDEQAWDVSLSGGYQYRPVQGLWTEDGKTRAYGLVENRVTTFLGASIALGQGFRLGMELPLVMFQNGVGVLPGFAGTNPVAFAGVGDLRLAPKYALFQSAAGSPVDVAVVGHISVPTSFPRHNYIGDGLPTLGAEIALSRDYGAFRWAFNAGPRLRAPSVMGNVMQGPEFGARFGVGYDFEKDLFGIPLGVDATANSTMVLYPVPLASNSNPSELLLGVHGDVEKLRWFVAAGYGMPGSGIGSPLTRVLAGVRYTPGCVDGDQDGICGDEDKCPDAGEDMDGYLDHDGCPDLDNDEDGVLDTADGCPTEPEDSDGFEDEDGCPDPDNDNDGVLDAQDRCPDVAGDVNKAGCPDSDADGIIDAEDQCPAVAGVVALRGCPDSDGDGVEDDKDTCPTVPGDAALGGCPDSDADGIPDTTDACPNAAETTNGFADEDGCPDVVPTRANVSENKIELEGKILFDVAMSTIKRESYSLLDEAAAILNAHPELTKVRIEGHTDSSGADAVNLELSEGRAASVMQYLIGKGVAASRLESKGFGESQPIASNATPEGREANRRVVFTIVERR